MWLYFLSAGTRKQKKKQKKNEVRIILVGKTGAGKSAAGNTILGREEFESELSSSSWTFQCKRAEVQIRGRNVAVIDTPGLFDTNDSEEEVTKKIKMCINLSAPGPHIFLVVLKLGRFTKEEEETVKMIQNMFGKDAARYSIVLFTHGDKLKKQTIEDFIEKSDKLKEFIRSFSGQYHVFNNMAEDQEQIDRLLWKIDEINLENGGKHYTVKMFRKAKKASEKEERRLSREVKEEEKRRRSTLRAEVEREIGGPLPYDRDSKCVLQ